MGATTDTTAAVERRAMFIKALRERLLGPGLPALGGPWAESLADLLRDYLPDAWCESSGLQVGVVSCFAEASDQDVDALFQALRESMSAMAQADDLLWANELTCFAFVRTLGDAVLTAHLSVPALAASLPRGASFPTRDALLASMAYTTLCTGLRFDGSRSGWKGRWIDLGKEFSDSTDLVDAMLRGLVLCCASPAERVDMPRRSNPDAAASEALIGELRTRFKANRRKREAAGVCICRPVSISEDLWAHALQQLAERLSADMVGYELTDAAHLSHAATQVTPAELKSHVDQVFQLLRQIDSGAPPASTDPVRSPAPPEWDFFVSHASEDKVMFVDELVARLKARDWRVWYDREQIAVGDRYVERIENGMKRSRSAVLVISRQSIAKSGWVPAEWEALLNEHISLGTKSVYPVLLGIPHDELIREKPLLGRCRSADGHQGADHVAEELIRAVLRRPGDTA